MPHLYMRRRCRKIISFDDFVAFFLITFEDWIKDMFDKKSQDSLKKCKDSDKSVKLIWLPAPILWRQFLYQRKYL